MTGKRVISINEEIAKLERENAARLAKNARERQKYADKKVQAVFDKVLATGLYAEFDSSVVIGGELLYSGRFMCDALHKCHRVGVITDSEYRLALTTIRQYLVGGWNVLSGSLRHCNLPCEFADRLAIYSNWANRPKLGDK